MRIGLLGPLEVLDCSGKVMVIGGTRPRLLLMRLALEPGRPVTNQALMDAIWPDEPPVGGILALREVVTQLRRSLRAEDAARLQVLPTGYRLNIPADHIDVGQFEYFINLARSASDPEQTRDYLDQALALFRGEPLATAKDAPFAAPSIARLQMLRQRTAAELDAAQTASLS